MANSVGVAGVDLDKVMQYVKENGGASSLALGLHDGVPGKVVRLQGPQGKGKLGLLMTTVHDNYFMFVKFNLKMPVSPTDRDATAKAELQLRRLQRQGVERLRRKRARLREGVHRPHQPDAEHPPRAGASPATTTSRTRT